MTNKSSDVSPNTIIIDPRMINYSNDTNDEISLVDLWLLLVKQKKVLFATFITIFGLGLFFMAIQPTLYDYKTTINIGTDQDKKNLIQPIETVKSELSSAYIDQALHKYYHDDNDKNIELTVNNPKNTSLIVLKSRGTASDAKTHLSIQQDILQNLVEKHYSTSQSIIDGLSNQKLTVSNKIQDLENDDLFEPKKIEAVKALQQSREQLKKLQEINTNHQSALVRLQSLRKLLQTQYKNDVDNLNTAIQNQQIASKNSQDTALLVLLTSELQQYRTRIALLDERLNIMIPAQEQEIRQNIADNEREQKNQELSIKQSELALTKLQIQRERDITSLKSELSKIDNDIKSLPITHAIVPPSRSFKPTNSKKKLLIISVSAVLGLLLGLFAALFAGFVAKTKSENQ